MKLTPEEGAERAHRFGVHQVQRYGAASMADWWSWRLKVSIWERDDRAGVLTRELFPWAIGGVSAEDVCRLRELFMRVKRNVARNVNATNTGT